MRRAPLPAPPAGPVLLGLLALAACGCNADFKEALADAGIDATAPAWSGRSVGAGCAADVECRPGLACTESRCAAAGRSPEGAACLLTAECVAGLACGWGGFCVTAGKAEAKDPCASLVDCEAGLTCDLIAGVAGVCTQPRATARDAGAECTDTLDCLAGLVCSTVSHTCVPGSLLLDPDVFPGVACPDESTLAFGARSALPGTGTTENADFYATPFPSDLRRPDGKLDLTQYPVPGPGLVGFDSLDAALRSLEAQAGGFSRDAVISVRFTRAVAPASLDGHVRLIALPSGTEVPFETTYLDDRGKFACAHRLEVRPKGMLSGGATYALLLTSGILSTDGVHAEPLDTLPELLGNTGAAAFAPLRTWLAHGTVATSDVIGATVFTTDDTDRLSTELHAAAAAHPAAPEGDAVKCAAGVKSPCALETFPDRDCPETPLATADEYHLRLKLPMVQTGDRPYRETGGALNRDAQGVHAEMTQSVCASVLVPKGTPPAGGWPLLVFAHGTGGHFRSHVPLLADLTDRFVILGYDGPMHGPRQGSGAPQDPATLFFNLRNPAATLGNMAQAVADLFALDPFTAGGTLRLTADVAVTIDPTRRVLWGDSQGGKAAAVAAGHGTWRGLVLTATGGDAIEGMLSQTSPTDASVGLRMLLQEGELDTHHPELGMLAWAFEALDPRLHAGAFAGQAPPHLLNLYGLNDSFQPASTQRRFAATVGGTLLKPDPVPEWFDDLAELGMASAPTPLQGNVADGKATVVTFEANNAADGTDDGQAYDGHFIAFRDRAARDRLRAWLDELRTADVPAVR